MEFTVVQYLFGVGGVAGLVKFRDCFGWVKLLLLSKVGEVGTSLCFVV